MPSLTELFLDDHLLAQTAGVSRRIHQPRKHRLNPVMLPETWWEGSSVMPNATLYDPEEGLFKMWYRTGSANHPRDALDGHVSYTAYAVSTDGVTWERPDLGALELAGRRDHSVVLVSEGQDSRANFTRQGKKGFILSVVRHPRPKDENEKYVCLFFDMKKRGAYLGYSADGIHWRRDAEPFWRTPVDVAAWGDDNLKSLIYDRLKERWVVYRRVIPQESERLVAQPGDEDWAIPDRTMRVMGYADSPDLKRWENHQIILTPDGDDPADIEIYGLTCHNYEQVYVGYLWIYHMAPGRENIDVQLVTSRDGIHLTRCCRREVFLPAGPPYHYDYQVSIGYQAEPIIVNDEVYLFFNAGNYYHTQDSNDPDARIACGLATFPRDRFVSLQTGVPQPCRVVTKPMVLPYPKLFLNAAAWGDGGIRVEVLTRDWKPIEGFTAAESVETRGNVLTHPARWKEHADLGPLVGREVRLKFYMTHARLHAMTLDTDDRPLKPLPDLKPSGDGYANAPVNV